MRKRSKYKPKAVLPDPVNWVLSGMKPLRVMSEATIVKIKNHESLLDITRGTGTRKHVDDLIAAMNVSEALYRVNADLGQEYAQEIREAQDAIYAMARRGRDSNKFLLTGPEMKAVNTGMEVHDAQLDACTVAELEKAMDLVRKEIRNHRARVIAGAEA
jgi:hypothetical protein